MITIKERIWEANTRSCLYLCLSRRLSVQKEYQSDMVKAMKVNILMSILTAPVD